MKNLFFQNQKGVVQFIWIVVFVRGKILRQKLAAFFHRVAKRAFDIFFAEFRRKGIRDYVPQIVADFFCDSFVRHDSNLSFQKRNKNQNAGVFARGINSAFGERSHCSRSRFFSLEKIRNNDSVQRGNIEQKEKKQNQAKTRKAINCGQIPFGAVPTVAFIERANRFRERQGCDRDCERNNQRGEKFPKRIVAAFRRHRDHDFARSFAFRIFDGIFY